MKLFSLLYYHTVNKKHMIRWKIIGYPRMQNILSCTRYSILQTLSKKQSANMICKFDRLRTAHRKRQKAIWALENLLATHAFDYIVLRVNSGLASCETLLRPCTCFTLSTHATGTLVLIRIHKKANLLKMKVNSMKERKVHVNKNKLWSGKNGDYKPGGLGSRLGWLLWSVNEMKF